MNAANSSEVIMNIKRLITEKGYKQGFIANKIGLSEREFSDIMCERKLLRVEHICPLAKALDVDCNELFQFKDA